MNEQEFVKEAQKECKCRDSYVRVNLRIIRVPRSDAQIGFVDLEKEILECLEECSIVDCSLNRKNEGTKTKNCINS